MRRKALASVVFLVLLFSVATELQIINLARANWAPPPTLIEIETPKNGTFYSSFPSLRLLILVPYATWLYNFKLKWVGYSLNGGSNVTITPVYAGLRSQGLSFSMYTASESLSNLSDGFHNLIVYTTRNDGQNSSSEVRFRVDAGNPDIKILLPDILFLSPENKTYYTTSIPLNFSTNERGAQVSYSLDGQENVTVTGNTTLTVLSNGAHNVTFYAQNNIGNIRASETIIFTIKEPEAELPAEFVIAMTVTSAVAVSAGLIIYFKKSRH